MLAFTPTGAAETGTYSEIEVETKNDHFDVRAREGYVVGDTYPYAEAPGGRPAR